MLRLTIFVPSASQTITQLGQTNKLFSWANVELDCQYRGSIEKSPVSSQSASAMSGHRAAKQSARRSRSNERSASILMDVDEPTVKLKSCDGKRFSLTKSEASCSNILRAMLESVQHESEYIELQGVDGKMLAEVIEWCRSHPINCQPNRERELADQSYLGSMEEEHLFRLMHAANYLDVKSLYSACCSITAKRWEGKRVEDIRRMYNIQSDFAPEEENQMLRDSRRLGMND